MTDSGKKGSTEGGERKDLQPGLKEQPSPSE